MREVRERAGYTVEGIARLLETTTEAVEAWEGSGDKRPLEVFYFFCLSLDASLPTRSCTALAGRHRVRTERVGRCAKRGFVSGLGDLAEKRSQ